MKSQLHLGTHAFALAILGALAFTGCYGTPATDDGEPIDDDEEDVGEAQEALVLQTCIGDNDSATTSCFKGLSVNGDWLKDTDNTVDKAKKYYGNNTARISNSCWPAPATYTFKTGSLGEVWFSAWIPAQNADWYAKYTVQCKNVAGSVSNTKVFSIPQGQYFGKWVTVGNLGYWEAGSTCTVKVEEDGWACSYSVAADGLKMTIYQ